MKKTNLMKTYFSLIITLVIVIYGVLILVFSESVAITTRNSLQKCLNTIIPSFFGFMVVSNIIIKSGVYVLISRPFSLLSKYVLKIRPELFSIFLVSNIGGYPVGIKTITDMIKAEKVSKKEAERMICFCYSCAPSFILTVAGIGLFNNIKIGLYIYISILLSNIIIAVYTGRKIKVPDKSNADKAEIVFNTKILIDSIVSTAKALFLICIMIVFFSVFINILSESGVISNIVNLSVSAFGFESTNTSAIINSMLEISNISLFREYSYGCIPLITALLSFGGICVFLQIISMCNKTFSLKYYYKTRLFQIIISSLISYTFLLLSDNVIPAGVMVRKIIIHNQKNFLGYICLIIMAIGLLLKLSIVKEKKL